MSLSPTIAAPAPDATAVPSAIDGEAEREQLRLEFEAIIAAAYGNEADEPRPAPPARRVATLVRTARPVGGGMTSVRGRARRPCPGPTARPVARERGPPRHRLRCHP